jgi:SET family sugar efflux transporter-like MFS transporter
LSAISLVASKPVFRTLYVTLACVGAFNASVYPYQSLIAIKHIGLTPGDFALILMVASFVNVAAAVLLGILADQRANRRQTALVCAISGLIGAVLMIVIPGPVALVLTSAVLLPIAQPLFGQVFALTRLASQGHEGLSDGVQSVIRSGLSITFLATLLFWTFAFRDGISEMNVYWTAILAAAVAVCLIIWAWPRDGATAWEDRRSGLNLPAALKQIGRPHIALRFFCLGAINAAGGLYMATVSLFFDASSLRGASDVALYVGMVAGWEVPFMLLLPRIIHRFNRANLIGIGAFTYVTHLMALPFLTDTPFIWVMPFVAGLGGTALLILPITYYQSLMERTPGAAASLMAVQKLVTDGLVAGCFAIGMAFWGLTAVAVMGTALSLLGAVLLVLADRGRWLMPKPPQQWAAE